jgi:hypothetical protein
MEELEVDPNPMAPIVLAHLQSLKTHKKFKQRLEVTWRLVRGLYDRGLNADQARQLFRLIIWFLDLPPEFQEQLREKIVAFEGERNMPWLSFFERNAMEKGRQEERKDMLPYILATKFGDEGRAFAEELKRIEDSAKLMEIFDAVRAGNRLDELRNRLR